MTQRFVAGGLQRFPDHPGDPFPSQMIQGLTKVLLKGAPQAVHLVLESGRGLSHGLQQLIGVSGGTHEDPALEQTT
jgi:hypothetical protein